MKALEVDRSRRYETALALADDLQRYLRQEPVTARPPTLSYQFSKFVRRHRVQAVAASVAILALVVGAIAAGVGLVRATRAEATARQEAATSKQVSDFLVRLFTLSNPDEAPGKPTTVRELLERGAGGIETDLKGQPVVQANLFGTISKVYEALGQYPESKRFAEKALALPHASGADGELQTAAVLLHPIHFDEHFASQSQHGRCLVNGTLVFALTVGMSVRDVSETAIANLEYEKVLHLAPTFHGDTIYAESEILEVTPSQSKPDRGVVYLETRAVNQKGERVLSLRRRVLIPRRPAS